MAKAQEPAAVGMEVEIIKDDQNYKKTGRICEIEESGTMWVRFDHTSEESQYEPEEVILFTDLPW